MADEHRHCMSPGCTAHAPKSATPLCSKCGASTSKDGTCAFCSAADPSAGFEQWLATRPPIIQQLAKQFPPDARYLLKAHGENSDYYYLHGYNEDGTVTLVRVDRVTGEPMWNVFGVKPESLIAARTDA